MEPAPLQDQRSKYIAETQIGISLLLWYIYIYICVHIYILICICIYIFFHIRKSMRRTTRVGLVPSNRFTHMGCFHFSKKDKNKGPEGLNNPRTAWPHYLCEIRTASQGQHVQSIETWAVNFQKGKDDWTNIVCVQSLPTGNGRPFIFRSLYN